MSTAEAGSDSMPVTSADEPRARRFAHPYAWALLGGAFAGLGVLSSFGSVDVGPRLAPSWLDLTSIFWACFATFYLARRLSEGGERTLVDQLVHGSALGVSIVFAVLCLPILPMALIGIVVAIGLLGLAPYWNLAALIRLGWLLPERVPIAEGRRPQLMRAFVLGLMLYPGLLLARFADAEWTLSVLRDVGVRPSASEEDPEDVEWTRESANRLATRFTEDELLLASYFADPTPELPGFASLDGQFERRRAEPLDQVAVLRTHEAIFRKTGRLAYQMAVPTRSRLLSRFTENRWAPRGLAPDVLEDDARRDDAVRGPLPMLRLGTSRFDLTWDAEKNLPFVEAEWEFSIRNQRFRELQTRHQFLLPPGAFCHGVELQVDGSWRRAAFGSEVKVAEAYVDTSNVRERWRRAVDPVLARQIGRDRFRVVGFPVLSRQAFRFRLHFTLPVRSGGEGPEVVLPVWFDRDVQLPPRFQQKVKVFRSDTLAPIAETTLGGRSLRDRTRCRVRLPNEVPASTIQSVAWPRPDTTPVLLMDTFHDIGAGLDQDFLREILGVPWVALVSDGEPRLIRPGALLDELGDAGFMAPFERFGGVERAIDQLVAQSDSPLSILWIHGASTLEPANRGVVLQIEERLRQHGSRIVAVPARTDQAPNTLVEALAGERVASIVHRRREGLIDEIREIRAGRALVHDAEEPGLRDAAADLDLEVMALADPEDALVQRLRGFDEMDRALAASDFERADAIARTREIVSPRIGAVVLERDEWYADYDLPTPRRTSAGSGVPEPETWFLILSGVALLWYVRRR